ncbi:MAG: fibrillarin-like rRNA/tRNA 2'-O-methyltransferase [Candidatus Aenigmatarchaeota archaeon]|nr:MAG: fibrillarin-like rRNA/tRNA 2'-O-methyltransferase [Candidatus Aenigmarchaeota archaeon]
MEEIFPGVWKRGEELLTLNLTPGKRFFSEKLVKIGNREYRVWDPGRSKAAAAIRNGLKTWPLKPGMIMLYLGIANGQTASFFSDILGDSGFIYGIEISERPFRELLPLAEARGNIMPLLANARVPEEYDWIEKVDIIYQDVATPDQAEIALRNAEVFLKAGGWLMIAIKARSIDVTKEPERIYQEEIEKLKRLLKLEDRIKLDPWEKDHLFAVLRL